MKRFIRNILRKKPPKHLHKNNNLHTATSFVVANNIVGDYYEFGVFKGDSFILAIKLFNKKIARLRKLEKSKNSPLVKQEPKFFAFDSFEGLPVDGINSENTPFHWKGHGVMSFAENKFLKTLKASGIDVSRVKTIKGFFNESLKPALFSELNLLKASIIHIDCDLYESTQDVFGFITPLIQDGTIIIFDDYYYYNGHPNKGERGAFNEWLKENPQFIATELCKFYPAASFIINII